MKTKLNALLNQIKPNVGPTPTKQIVSLTEPPDTKIFNSKCNLRPKLLATKKLKTKIVTSARSSWLLTN